jgi:dTDP-D-glucose 4,6-dehydratase
MLDIRRALHRRRFHLWGDGVCERESFIFVGHRKTIIAVVLETGV